MEDQSAVLSQLVALAAQAALAVVVLRLVGAVALGGMARALAAARVGGVATGVALAAVRVSPRCTRRVVTALAGAGLAVGLAGPVAATPPGPAPGLPVLDRMVEPVLGGASMSWREPLPRHRVQVGDSLWSIAADRLGPSATPAQVADAWPRWFARNRAVIGPDPAHLEPGQLLRSPSVVRGGERA